MCGYNPMCNLEPGVGVRPTWEANMHREVVSDLVAGGYPHAGLITAH